MANTFLISDPHFGHQGVCEFISCTGVGKLRPWETAEEMDAEMEKRWNDRVKPKDKIYILGDVAIAKKGLDILERLNGDKVLIKGNHDIYELKNYAKYFRDIRAYHVLEGLIFSHIPIHPESLGRFGCNVHGHLHDRRVMKDGKIDVRYFSVCVEHHDFTPVYYEDVLKMIEWEGGVTDMRSDVTFTTQQAD